MIKISVNGQDYRVGFIYDAPKTYCRVTPVNSDTLVAFGCVSRFHKDLDRKKTARKKAFASAVHGWIGSRSDRADVWKQFFQQVRMA